MITYLFDNICFEESERKKIPISPQTKFDTIHLSCRLYIKARRPRGSEIAFPTGAKKKKKNGVRAQVNKDFQKLIFGGGW